MSRAIVRAALVAALCLWPAAALASDYSGAPDAPGAMTGRMMMLVIQLGLIVFAARLGNRLFERLRLPGPLGELAAGILIGPYALGRIGLWGFPHGLFPHPAAGHFAVSPELYGISAIAAVVLLFTIGLETDLRLLLRYSLAGALVGLGGVLGSFFLGAATVMVFSEPIFGHSLGLFSPEALLLGAITTATSVGITARVLSDRHKLDSPEGVTILSAAVIDDVLAIIVLAVVMGVITASRGADGVDWARIIITTVKAVGVWLAATVLGLAASRRISVLLKWFGDRTAIAVMALGLAMILAGLFEEAGLAMIIGAYVMGLSLSRSDVNRVIQDKLRPVYSLLVPVFFCTTGMLIDIGALTSPPLIVFGLVYALVAMAAKVLGCGLPALLADFNLRGAARIGFGMSPRCEVALIIAGVGLSAGVLDARILAAVIIMVMVNTIVAPSVMVLLYRSDARGTRRPVPVDTAGQTVTFQFPSPEMAEFFIDKLESVFDDEGFFVYQISRTQRRYEARKDQIVIAFRQDGSGLTFRCRRRDVQFVNTVVYEGLAMLEQAVRGLKQPVDAEAFGERLQEGGLPVAGAMSLKDYLSPRLIEPNLRGRNKQEVIDELLGLLARNGLLKDLDAAREAVRQREQSMSTGLQHGVAIPHGKTDAVDRLVCAVGVHRAGVDFDAMDDEPSNILILTLSPRSRPAPHVQFMSTISQALNETGRRRVLAAQTQTEILDALTAPPTAPVLTRPPGRPGAKFRVADYIRPELLVPRLVGTTREEIIRELIDVMDRGGVLTDAESAARTVLARESQMSTGMGEGVAIPHGRTDAVVELLCAVGLKGEGVDFGAADGRPSRIFVLVLTPRSGIDPYLQFVASIMGVLDEAGRERLLAASTPRQMQEILTSQGR